MITGYKSILTYALTQEENEKLERQHSTYDFEDASGCFTDLLALNPLAIILNPEKLSESELGQLDEVDSIEDLAHNELYEIIENANKSFVAFDVETTGFSATANRIIEIGAVKVENGKIIAEFSQLINPGTPISQRIAEITGIAMDMLAGMPAIDETLPRFLEFCKGYTLVAHNAKFDMSFLSANVKRLGLPNNCTAIDTLGICRKLFPKLENHRLGTVANYLDVELRNHHRATDDAKAVAHIFLQCAETSRELLHLQDAKYPLFILTKPASELTMNFPHEICNISDEQEIVGKLSHTKMLLF